jgi:L-threonylcarbamoyladenylate synthase
VAPSANPEGKEPAKTIEEAKRYFTDKVDFYVDAGKLDSQPSTLISIINGAIEVLREGVVKIEA